MKTTYKYILSAVLLAAGFYACSPDDYPTLHQDRIPVAGNYSIEASVDQDINQVTLRIVGNPEGVYPIWYLDDSSKPLSTVNGYQQIFGQSGTHTLRAQIANANGISDGVLETSFTINNTIIDFSRFVTLLGKGTWRIDNETPGHMACGGSATSPDEWWSASVNDKADFGIYDNRLTFSDDRVYTFDPGAAGTMYVNKGTTLWKRDESADFQVEVPLTTADYDFDVSGDDVFLTLPARTPFPYIPSDAAWDNPRYLIRSLTAKSMTLISVLDGISWQYILTTGEAAVAWNGFNANSADNLWKSASKNVSTIYYAPGWSQIADPDYTLTDTGLKVTLPSATTDQWQAQVHVATDLSNTTVPADATYDFSCKINSNQTFNGVTIKLVSTTNDGNFFCAERVAVAAYEESIFYFYEVPGIALDGANLKIAFDFGGCPDGTEVEISDICFIDHSKNSIVPPSDEPGPEEPGIAWVDVNSADNLWTQANPVSGTIYYAPGWAQIDNFKYTISDNLYHVVLPSATSDQWQAQWHLETSLTNAILPVEETYDFRATVLSTTDHPAGITFKLTDNANDGAFFFANRVPVTAYEETEVVFSSLPGVALDGGTAFKLVLDFGGNAAETEVTIKDIILQKHRETGGGGSAPAWDYDAASNLWKSAALSLGEIYYAPGWAQIDNFAHTIENHKLTATLTAETFGQWQAQFQVATDIDKTRLSAEKKYDFHCVVSSTQDHPGITVKICEIGANGVAGSLGVNYDANALCYEPGIQLKAYEEHEISLTHLPGIQLQDNALKLVLDFGGNAANTEITITDIILREAE